MLMIYLFGCQVLVAARRTFVTSGGSLSVVHGLSLVMAQRLFLQHAGLVALQHMGTYFLYQGSNLHPLLCKTDS